MKTAYDIIVRPVLTEKSYDTIADKKYVFVVDIHANKTQIKAAVEEIFGVKVDSVNTLRTMGRTPEIKKAYVTLKKDSKPIEFFEGMAQ